MSERAMSDRQAVFVALLVAIDTERSLIDAYRNHLTGKVDESEQGVQIARRRIEAFERVLKRRYPNHTYADVVSGPAVSLFAVVANRESGVFDASRAVVRKPVMGRKPEED